MNGSRSTGRPVRVDSFDARITASVRVGSDMGNSTSDESPVLTASGPDERIPVKRRRCGDPFRIEALSIQHLRRAFTGGGVMMIGDSASEITVCVGQGNDFGILDGRHSPWVGLRSAAYADESGSKRI